MYQGSCLCRAVRFEIHGPLDHIVYCHCSRCRRSQGSAYATNGNVAKADFKFVSGEDMLTVYEHHSTPGHCKYFCKVCGSPVMSTHTAKPDNIRIRLGTIASAIEERPQAHIFVTSKANWDEIHDDLPQYEGYMPGQ